MTNVYAVFVKNLGWNLGKNIFHFGDIVNATSQQSDFAMRFMYFPSPDFWATTTVLFRIKPLLCFYAENSHNKD